MKTISSTVMNIFDQKYLLYLERRDQAEIDSGEDRKMAF